MRAVYTKTLTETKEEMFRSALSRRIFLWFFFLIYSIVRDTKNRLKSSRGLKVNLVISLHASVVCEGVPVRDAGRPRV